MGLQRWDVEVAKDAPGWLRTALKGLQNKLGRTPIFGAVRSVTASSAAVDSDYLILADVSGGGLTVTLPPAAQNMGRSFAVLKSDASGNTLTLDGNGSETINGSATKTTTTQYAGWTVFCDGSNWWVLP